MQEIQERGWRRHDATTTLSGDTGDAGDSGRRLAPPRRHHDLVRRYRSAADAALDGG